MMKGHQILSLAIIVPDVENDYGTAINPQSTPSFDELYNVWVDNDKTVSQEVIQNDRYDTNSTMEGSTYESLSDSSQDIDIDHDDAIEQYKQTVIHLMHAALNLPRVDILGLLPVSLLDMECS
jgi:hypothetical protein